MLCLSETIRDAREKPERSCKQPRIVMHTSENLTALVATVTTAVSDWQRTRGHIPVDMILNGLLHIMVDAVNGASSGVQRATMLLDIGAFLRRECPVTPEDVHAAIEQRRADNAAPRH
jgi:hypothetical protein